LGGWFEEVESNPTTAEIYLSGVFAGEFTFSFGVGSAQWATFIPAYRLALFCRYSARGSGDMLNRLCLRMSLRVMAFLVALSAAVLAAEGQVDKRGEEATSP
jgi:hypothetical protein